MKTNVCRQADQLQNVGQWLGGEEEEGITKEHKILGVRYRLSWL